MFDKNEEEQDRKRIMKNLCRQVQTATELTELLTETAKIDLSFSLPVRQAVTKSLIETFLGQLREDGFVVAKEEEYDSHVFGRFHDLFIVSDEEVIEKLLRRVK